MAIKSIEQFRLLSDENVFEDEKAGIWYAEVLEYPNDPEAKWMRVGTFGSRKAAIIYLVSIRSSVV